MTQQQARYPYFGIPPSKQPRPANEEPALRGKRVVLSMPDGFVYDMRAVSQIYPDDGRELVDIVSEEHYYRWMFTEVAPKRQPFPAHLVWVE